MKLFLKDVHISLPTFYYKNGRLELDVVSPPSLTRNLYEINTEKALRVTGFASCTIARKGLALQVFGTGTDSFKKEHEAVLDISGIQYPVVIQISKVTSNSYEAELSLLKDSWVSKLVSMKLNEVILGESAVISKDMLGDSMATNYMYDDANPPVVWGLSWNGRTIMKHLDNGAFAVPFYAVAETFLNEDFRFWVSPLALFRQAFCQAGFTFNCPILETEFGRRAWMYLLSENFYEQDGLRDSDRTYGGKLWNFQVESPDEVEISTLGSNDNLRVVIPMVNAVFDESGGLDTDLNTFWEYKQVYSDKYKLKFTGDFRNDNDTNRELIVSFYLVPLLTITGQDYEVQVGDTVIHPVHGLSFFEFRANPSATNVAIVNGNGIFEVDINDLTPAKQYDKKTVVHQINAKSSSILEFEWETQLRPKTRILVVCKGSPLSFSAGFEWQYLENVFYKNIKIEGFVKGQHFYTGDKVKYQNCLRKDSVMDVLKGVMDCLNLKVDEEVNGTDVFFYQEDDVTVPSLNGEVPVSGFYRDYQYADERNSLVSDSLIFSSVQNDRFLKIGFKGVDAFNVPDDEKENALTRTIDRGGLNEDTEEIRNPYFYGTVDVIAPNTAGNFQDGLWLPNLATDEDTYTTSVHPRICWAQWFGAQTRRQLPFYFANNDYSDTCLFSWERGLTGASDSLLLYLSCDPQALSSPVGTRGRAFTYGNRPMDFYERFWARRIRESYPFSNIEAILLWDRVKAQTFSFRNKVLLYHKGIPDVYKLQAIKDIDANRDLPVLVSLTRGSSVFNPVPCDCETKTCWAYNPYNPTDYYPSANAHITFFEVEGNEYILSPLPLGAPNTQTIGGISIITNIVDALNSLNIDGFTFEATPAPVNPNTDYHQIKITYPACVRFTMIVRENNLNTILWLFNEKGSYKYNDAAQNWYTDLYPATNGMREHIGCTTTKNDCDVC